jgi:hypothetical protein
LKETELRKRLTVGCKCVYALNDVIFDVLDTLFDLRYLISKDIPVGYAVYKGTFGMN